MAKITWQPKMVQPFDYQTEMGLFTALNWASEYQTILIPDFNLSRIHMVPGFTWFQNSDVLYSDPPVYSVQNVKIKFYI
jgi:hypothetical protein